MNNRERNWYEGKHGRHPPTCRCPECEARRHQPYNDIGYNTAKRDREQLAGDIDGSGGVWDTGRDSGRLDSHAYTPPIEIHPAAVSHRRRRSIVSSYRRDGWGALSRILRRLAKLSLGILILVGFCLLVEFGYRVFTEQVDTLWGPILLLVGLVAWVLVIRFYRSRRFKWVAPSFRLVTVLVMLVSIVLSLVDVQPLVSYKDHVVGYMASIFADVAEVVDGVIHPYAGEYNGYHLGLVRVDGEVTVGAGCYDNEGDFIILINSDSAVDPSYSQLVDFLWKDDTDQFPYVSDLRVWLYSGSAESNVNLDRVHAIIDGVEFPSDPKMCGDFAERLHNNAELSGIRCSYVCVKLAGNADHACNAFLTTDRGLVYVDVTGWSAGTLHPNRAVATVDIVVGQSYRPVSLFHEAGWSDEYFSVGTVVDFQVSWDGSWNS